MLESLEGSDCILFTYVLVLVWSEDDAAVRHEIYIRSVAVEVQGGVCFCSAEVPCRCPRPAGKADVKALLRKSTSITVTYVSLLKYLVDTHTTQYNSSSRSSLPT